MSTLAEVTLLAVLSRLRTRILKGLNATLTVDQPKGQVSRRHLLCPLTLERSDVLYR